MDEDNSFAYKERCQKMLAALRKITQAISSHSKNLYRKYGLTGPQLIILNDIAAREPLSVTQLARSISLSQATVTDILNRLEKKGLVVRQRDMLDRRRVMIRTTPQCNEILSQAPPALQEAFVERYRNLPEWEQLMILSALQRIVDLMTVDKVEPAPFLTADHLSSKQGEMG